MSRTGRSKSITLRTEEFCTKTIFSYDVSLVTCPRAPSTSYLSYRLHWNPSTRNLNAELKLSKNYTDALLGRQDITACCAIPKKLRRDGMCLKAHGIEIEQRCVEQ